MLECLSVCNFVGVCARLSGRAAFTPKRRSSCFYSDVLLNSTGEVSPEYIDMTHPVRTASIALLIAAWKITGHPAWAGLPLANDDKGDQFIPTLSRKTLCPHKRQTTDFGESSIHLKIEDTVESCRWRPI